jgi:hypothetical protein
VQWGESCIVASLPVRGVRRFLDSAEKGRTSEWRMNRILDRIYGSDLSGFKTCEEIAREGKQGSGFECGREDRC